MKSLKTGEDLIQDLQKKSIENILFSYTWNSKDEKISFSKNHKQVWVAHLKEYGLVPTINSMTFATRNEAIEVAKLLYPQIDLSQIKRYDNLLYEIKGTPIKLSGRAGSWHSNIDGFSEDSNGNCITIEKYDKIREYMNWEISAEDHKKFWKNSKVGALQAMMDFLSSEFLDIIKEDSWAWK